MVTARFRLRPVGLAALVCAAVAAAGCGGSGTGGTVPIILFVLFFQRRIVAGLTGGAGKG